MSFHFHVINKSLKRSIINKRKALNFYYKTEIIIFRAFVLFLDDQFDLSFSSVSAKYKRF